LNKKGNEQEEIEQEAIEEQQGIEQEGIEIKILVPCPALFLFIL
jgi:hypothetical protein